MQVRWSSVKSRWRAVVTFWLHRCAFFSFGYRNFAYERVWQVGTRAINIYFVVLPHVFVNGRYQLIPHPQPLPVVLFRPARGDGSGDPEITAALLSSTRTATPSS
jgi:hypothetical protein